MRFVIGSLVAGAVMWLLGFVFYGLLFDVGWATAPEATQLAIQSALKALPHTGSYAIPMGETPAMMAAHASGPIAQVVYNARGYPMVDPATFIGGFVQFAVVAAMLGWLLHGLGARVDFIGQARVVIGLAAVAVVYIHLADPVWYHADWRNAVFKSVADLVILSAGGLVMARWFVTRRSTGLR
ncbi:hypothetical protein KX816_10520 [Sphingosinicellaceae bacterium]|nr:hypothetical protein KX816_10520 [Sphingosinicellaceae bacterium]